MDFSFDYHEVITDIGLAQQSPLSEDLPATIRALEKFLPIPPERLESLQKDLVDIWVLCRLLRYLTTRHRSCPGRRIYHPVLIENFTWDWIYSGFLNAEPEFNRFIPAFADLFKQATKHIQTQPICSPTGNASMQVSPVSRKPRRSRSEVRSELGVPENARMVLVSMGGFELQYSFLDKLYCSRKYLFCRSGRL